MLFMDISQEKNIKFLKNGKISKSIIDWGIKNYRDFPWRYTFNPFNVAISEMLLRRTKASHVTDVYMKITEIYSNMCDLGGADIKYISRIISSLGINGRIYLILKAASYICENYGGNIPEDRNILDRIPGFGDYTVSAIRVFGFQKNDPLIDVNTVRILARMSGIKLNDSLRRSELIHKIYSCVLGDADPVKFGYAILDMGAIVCKSTPSCSECPVSEFCSYFTSLKK